MKIAIEPSGGFHPDATLNVLCLHAIPGAELHSPGERSHSRLLRIAGNATPVTARLTPGLVEVSAPLPPSARAEFESAVRFWLDLDTDLGPIESRLVGDPLLAPLIGKRRGLRQVRFPDGFEAAAATVLGQQVSLAAARTLSGRFTRAFGTRTDSGLTAFPKPDAVAALSAEEIRGTVGLTATRAATIKALAESFVAGLSIGPGADWAISRKTLIAIPGIGPWTVDYLSVRAIGDPDGFAPGDLVLRRALGNPTIRQAAERAKRWSPWRAYALAHLWAEATPKVNRLA